MDLDSLVSQMTNLSDIPPLELSEEGGVWILRTYRRGDADGRIFSTHDSSIDAIRAAKARMEDHNHPCTLRWEAPKSVGALYWNPLFEYLDVRYDELLDTWTIAPANGTCPIETAQSRRAASKRGKQIQRDYNFKHLRVYDEGGGSFEERDHRFLRHDITSSGVRFNPSALDRQPTTDTTTDDTADADESDPYDKPASPGQLGASIPDVTKVEFISTDGDIHRYATPWGDGTAAEIIAVSQKHSTNSQVRDAFDTWLSRWKAVATQSHVATVHESGTDPLPWVAYQVGETTLQQAEADLSTDERLSVLKQICTAVNTVATGTDEPACGVSPSWIHLHTDTRDTHVTISQLGIEWAVQHAAGSPVPTPYTAPEQLDGNLTQTTSVYQLGAVAYFLLCDTPPLPEESDESELESRIRRGDIPSARPIDGIPTGVGSLIDRALRTAPADRYDSVEAFCRVMQNSF